MILDKKSKIDEPVITESLTIADKKSRSAFDTSFGKKERDRHYL